MYKDEGGDREDEKILSENLLEEKSSLIDLTESEDKGSGGSGGSASGGGGTKSSGGSATSGRSSSGANSGGGSRPDHSPVFGESSVHIFFRNLYFLNLSRIIL